jgi:hypothetical protein
MTNSGSGGVFGCRCWTLVGRGLVQRTSSLLLQRYLGYMATRAPFGQRVWSQPAVCGCLATQFVLGLRLRVTADVNLSAHGAL